MTAALDHRRVLVIKHGALGDFIQALAPMQAIRRAHAEAHITLLTTAPFAGLAEASGWFDDIWLDDRPSIARPHLWLGLIRQLRRAGFDRVYDLQTSDRTGHYFRMLSGPSRPEWSGIAAGCSHPHDNLDRDRMHTRDRQAEQLNLAGIADVPDADLDWLNADVADLLPESADFALLVPGGSAHRPEKRWPAAAFVELAQRIAGQGMAPLLIGGGDETELCERIAATVPAALSLAGRTGFAELAGLARRARLAVGNDTGPMHLVAALGCRSVVLFSDASDPDLCAPRGQSVSVLRSPSLAELGVDEVAAAAGLAKAGATDP